MPALEEDERQTQQMGEQTIADVGGDAALQVDQDAGAEQSGHCVEQHGEPEAEGEYGQQAAVIVDNSLVHRKLHVKWTCQHIGLQDH